jgi:hypothetical protein
MLLKKKERIRKEREKKIHLVYDHPILENEKKFLTKVEKKRKKLLVVFIAAGAQTDDIDKHTSGKKNYLLYVC